MGSAEDQTDSDKSTMNPVLLVVVIGVILLIVTLILMMYHRRHRAAKTASLEPFLTNDEVGMHGNPLHGDYDKVAYSDAEYAAIHNAGSPNKLLANDRMIANQCYEQQQKGTVSTYDEPLRNGRMIANQSYVPQQIVPTEVTLMQNPIYLSGASKVPVYGDGEAPEVANYADTTSDGTAQQMYVCDKNPSQSGSQDVNASIAYAIPFGDTGTYAIASTLGQPLAATNVKQEKAKTVADGNGDEPVKLQKQRTRSDSFA